MAYTQRISPEWVQLLEKGKVKLTVKGTVLDEGEEDQPLSIYISDTEDPEQSQTCPLIFTAEFQGHIEAQRAMLQYKKGWKKITLINQQVDKGITRAEVFTIVLTVKPNTAEAAIGTDGTKLGPADRTIGFTSAKYVVVAGAALDKTSVEFGELN